MNYNNKKILFVKFETMIRNFPLVIKNYNEMFDCNYKIDEDIITKTNFINV